ncbi:MAG: hypothetical protein LQ338_005887, partial [Usnochroma carphineum]
GGSIAGAIIWFLCIRKRRNSSSEVTEPGGINIQELDVTASVQEKDASSARQELWDREPHSELSGHAKAELSG